MLCEGRSGVPASRTENERRAARQPCRQLGRGTEPRRAGQQRLVGMEPETLALSRRQKRLTAALVVAGIALEVVGVALGPLKTSGGPEAASLSGPADAASSKRCGVQLEGRRLRGAR